MNTQALLVLDTRYQKQDGTYPIILRIVHNRKSAQIKLGIFIDEKHWDDQRRVIKPTYRGTESLTRLNNLLQKKRTEAIDLFTKLEEAKTLNSYSVYQLRDLIEKKADRESFFKYAEEVMEEMLAANRIGGARAYKIPIGVLKKFQKGKDLTFQDLNYAFLLKFETAHFAKGNSQNGLASYMRIIRALFNKAIKAGIVSRELYPFANYQIKTTKTQKRAISLEVLKRIIDLKLEPANPLFDSRNFFLASFYMRGMPFVDLAQLKIDNIIDGRIYYQRQKTDKPYNVKITSELEEILSCYIKRKRKGEFIFPVIHRETALEQYKDVEWGRKGFNKKLKKIAELCGIEENLTSYVSRHSFATRAKNLGVPIATISDMLGHADTKTTEVYLDSLPSDIMDDFHEKVIR